MDIGSVLGVVGIVVGLVSSYVFYKMGKKKRKLVYNLETTVLISEKLSKYEKLKISYNGENIKRLDSANIKIKNIGNTMIEPKDLVPTKPITIETSEKFLIQDVSNYTVNCSNPKNRVSLSRIDDSHLEVVFDFLNPKDEISITILHTGEISVTGDLKQGEVKNYSNKKYETTSKDSENLSSNGRYTDSFLFENLYKKILILMLIMLIVVFMFMLLVNFYIDGGFWDVNQYDLLSIMLTGLSICVMTFLFMGRR